MRILLGAGFGFLCIGLAAIVFTIIDGRSGDTPAPAPVVAEAAPEPEVVPTPEPDPEPEPEAAAEPEGDDPRQITLAALREARAAALEARATAEASRLAAIDARNAQLVEAALGERADLDFDSARRDTARRHRLSCLQKNHEDCVALGRLYRDGTAVWSDEPLARALFQ